MKAAGYRGCYQLNGGMMAIRQSDQEGKSAICLHDSLKDFSDKAVVVWNCLT